MRIAFAKMVSNTGSRSPGDVLMTCSTSAGRRLLLQRFAQFAEQPRVLDGDDRLGGEVLHQRDLLVGERPDFLPIDRDSADQLAVLAASARRRTSAAPPSFTAASGDASRPPRSVVADTLRFVRRMRSKSVPGAGVISAALPLEFGKFRRRLRPLRQVRISLRSQRYRLPNLASQMRTAFRASLEIPAQARPATD